MSRRQPHVRRIAVLTTVALTLLTYGTFNAFVQSTGAAVPGTSHFQRTWDRTDKPVYEGLAVRTWVWGIEPFTDLVIEEYQESPEQARQVQYFDKSRMEITDPFRPNPGIWFVTNGLLVVEMISGQMQLGDDTFVEHGVSMVNVAGDPDDTFGPTYAAFDQHRAPVADRTGETVIDKIDRDGNLSEEPDLLAQGVQLSHYDEITGHNIASPFWDFMNSEGTVYEDGLFFDDLLFAHPVYATGRPISEPYFAESKVSGSVVTVLVQCFERRCLTYTPSNRAGFQVEAGNVGLHYFCWRYGFLPEGKGECIGSPVDPQPPPPPADDVTPTPPGGDGGADPTATSPGGGGGSNPTATSPDGGGGGSNPTATSPGGGGGGGGGSNPTATSPGGGGGSDPTATTPGGGDPDPTATSPDPNPTSTSPSGSNDPAVDVLPLNYGTIEVGIGQAFTLPVRVQNTGTQTDEVDIRLRTTSGISTCPFDETTTRTIGAGQTVTVNFSHSCLIALDVIASFEATATINRAPGASDTETDSAVIRVGVLGGGDPTATPTTPPPVNDDPSVDVLPLNYGTITVGIGQAFTLPVRVRNTGTQTDDVDIRLRTTGGISLCPLDSMTTRTIGPGQTVTVNFSHSCLISLDVIASFEATATIDRAPGASDTETDTAVIQIGLLSNPSVVESFGLMPS